MGHYPSMKSARGGKQIAGVNNSDNPPKTNGTNIPSALERYSFIISLNG
jgi:hypothetical protein